MPEFWIDSDVLIGAKDGLFAFDIAPRFWSALDTHAHLGRISSPAMVLHEINNGFPDDVLRQWAKEREHSHFSGHTPEVEREYRRVVAYAMRTYAQAFVDPFADGADQWLIAHALAQGGRVVSHEAPSQQQNPNRQTGLIAARIKLPNVCEYYGIESVMLHEMLRALGVNDL